MMIDFFSEQFIQALGWTFIHSLWQGVLIALVLLLTLNSIDESKSKLRYWLGNLALCIVAASAIGTFSYYFFSAISDQQPWDGLSQQIAFFFVEHPSNESQFLYVPSILQWIENQLPLICQFWLIGSVFFLLKALGGLGFIHYLKRSGIHSHHAQYDPFLLKLNTYFKINKKIRVLESALVKAPMVVGFFKPIIFFPIGAINQLSPQQVEAILAHELAHIYRNDYLFNLIQTFVESIFYYHPAVWWISANIRYERESCCDAIAVRVTGNRPLDYAKTLLSIQEKYQQSPVLAVPFLGQKNQFLYRIQRILNQSQNRFRIMEKLIVSILFLLAVLGISFGNGEVTETKPSAAAIEAITTPQKKEQKTAEKPILKPKPQVKTIPPVLLNQSPSKKVSEVLTPPERSTIIEDVSTIKPITIQGIYPSNLGSLDSIPKTEETEELIESILEKVEKALESRKELDLDLDIHPHIRDLTRRSYILVDSLGQDISKIDEEELNRILKKAEKNLEDFKFKKFDLGDFEKRFKHLDHIDIDIDKHLKNFEHSFKHLPRSSHLPHLIIGGDFMQKIERELIRDGFTKEGEEYNFSLDLDKEKLKINGKKQSKGLFNKYKNIYTKDKDGTIKGKIEIKKKAESSNRKIIRENKIIYYDTGENLYKEKIVPPGHITRIESDEITFIPKQSIITDPNSVLYFDKDAQKIKELETESKVMIMEDGQIKPFRPKAESH